MESIGFLSQGFPAAVYQADYLLAIFVALRKSVTETGAATPTAFQCRNGVLPVCHALAKIGSNFCS